MVVDDSIAHEKTDLRLVVEYECVEDLLEDYENNLSVGGMFVHTERNIAKGTAVDLILSFPGLLKPIGLAGVVRWTSAGTGEAENGVGIEFTGHDQLARARLKSIIDAIRTGDRRFVGRPMSVLLVEDNPHIAQLIQDGLFQSSRRGFSTRVAFDFTTAYDGLEAVDLLDQLHFDALIVDMQLPGLDGPDVIRKAKAFEHLRGVPVIGISASPQGEELAQEAGCNYFLAKPLRLRQLLDVMSQLLDDTTPQPTR